MVVVSKNSSNSTAFKEFSNYHENLGIILKTMSVGLVLCEEALAQGSSSEELWEKLDAKDIQWGTMPQISPTGIIEGQIQIGNLGAVQGFSAFDAFIEGIRSELDSYNYKFGIECPYDFEINDDESDTLKQPLSNFCERYAFNQDAISFVLPVYEYYQSARNCIVHRRGLASKHFGKICSSEALEKSSTSWKENTGEHGSLRIRKFRHEEKIEFDFSDAILASSTLRLVALDVDRQAVEKFGRNGLVYLAAKKMLRDCENGTFSTVNRSAADSIAYQVGHVNRFENLKGRDVPPILKDLGLLADCNRAFEKSKGEIVCDGTAPKQK